MGEKDPTNSTLCDMFFLLIAAQRRPLMHSPILSTKYAGGSKDPQTYHSFRYCGHLSGRLLSMNDVQRPGDSPMQYVCDGSGGGEEQAGQGWIRGRMGADIGSS